jgi:hypothetical protein
MLYLFFVLSVIDPRIRPLDHSAQATVARAMERSPLVRRMARELDRTDVIVHCEMSRDLPGGIGGATRFVASRGGYRYLRISISSQLPPDARVAMFGHELQHALEIARSGAHDVEALRQLWHQYGYLIHGRFYESEAALRVERAVRKELRSSQAEPVIELHHEHLGAGGAKAGAQVAKR